MKMLNDQNSESHVFKLTQEELEVNVLAVKASLRDMDQGETGRPIKEFAAEFIRKMASTMFDDIRAVLDQLSRGPALVRQVIHAVPKELRKRRPEPGMWSAHEHAVHLAMIDPIMTRRLDYMLSDPAPRIKSYEPSRDEEEGALLKLDLDAEMDRYERQRAAFLERLHGLTPEQWQITAEHDEYSHYGVFIMARHVCLHDLHHAYKIEVRLLRKSWD